MSFDDDEEEQQAVLLLNNSPSRRRPAHDDGEEDRRPTTKRELQGWYAYPVAAEVFAVVAVGAFLPVILEQLARENGVFFDDRTTPCVEKSGLGKPQLRGNDHQKESSNHQCVIDFLGKSMTTSSFAMYTSSTAVIVQAFTLVCLSSFADYGPYRKKMLMGFTYTGSLASSLFIFVSPTVYYLAPILVVLGVTSLGCAFVLLNAFLPLLVANHPRDTSTTKLGSTEPASNFELENLNPETGQHHPSGSDGDQLQHDLKLSATISSNGVGFGYISAVFVQILSILVLWGFSNTSLQKNHPSLPIRVVLLLVGVWWIVFSIPTALFLRPRPGPALPTRRSESSSSSSLSSIRKFLFYMSFSLKSFWKTLLRATSLRQTRTFLIAWFLLSDAVATISGTAVLFARTELNMGTIAIALLSITSIGCGVGGAFLWPRIQRKYSLQPKTVLICCIGGLEIVSVYGLLGFIPLFKRLGFIGLQQPWEIYVIAVIHGITMGGISSYARSVYAPLIPEGSEASFFALYAVTDKGSSAVGPALIGAIADRYGSIRPAFIFLAVVVILPAPLLWWLDVEKGRDDAKSLAEGDGPMRAVYERVADDQIDE